jgi:ABC-type nickel/cobalt efflux system permease component RcnA
MLATFFSLQSRYRTALVLGMLLPAYLLVVCGLFNWLPVLFFGQQHHQFEVADKGAMVEWVIHHNDEHTHEHSHEPNVVVAEHHEDTHADDHTLTLPCADEIKQSLSVQKLLWLVPLLLWCWCYFAWHVYARFYPVYFPSVPIICRNSLLYMTRTIVMRH